jgi:methylenetetrahydrofolate dehydrogenase (NADP+)/methenyltetrahydrofolate cyclohydrolase
MAAIRLNGTLCATAIRGELTPRVAVFASAHGRAPSLHILLVGDDPASQVYVRNKGRAGLETGLHVTVHRLPATSTREEVLNQVRELNLDASCDGILVRAPLPAGSLAPPAAAPATEAAPSAGRDPALPGWPPWSASNSATVA